MVEQQDFTIFWIGVTIAYSIVIALAWFGGKMIEGKRTRNSTPKT